VNDVAGQLDAVEALEADDAKAKAFTTPEVNQMLWNKYTENGEYVFLFDVPDVVGIKQRRRCDGIAIGMWGSTGRLIHGFEVKISRSDWLRELKDVSKADPFIERCDRWWLVTGSASVAKLEEIPAAWGWMSATKTGLRVQRPPQILPQDERRMERLWAFALIRRAAERGSSGSPEFQARLTKEREHLERRAKTDLEIAIRNVSPAFDRLRKQVDEFEKHSGMKLDDWRLGNVGKLARRLFAISEDGYGGFKHTLEAQLRALKQLAEQTQECLTAFGAPELSESDET